MSEGGYRETESGLDASFLWAHDKSEKDGERERGGGVNRGFKKGVRKIMQSHKREREKS